MPGTGIHGYTGTSANGLYNISNGIIQSSAPSTNGNSYYSGSSNNVINSIANNVVSAASNASNQLSSLAQGVANVAQTSNTDYGDMIRDILAQSQKNTAQSQQFAREQMEYQTRSDQAAMAWSAQEAQKNRAWQESLADTAHQREVRDLVAAGLNPILSSNAGAYTGSGATGQGFSSSGSMGQVDTSSNLALSNMFSSIMNTASNAYVAGLYTDAERYASDLQYSASRLATEASITNNENTNSSQKWIATNQMLNDLERTRIQGEYGLQNTGLANEGAYSREQLSQESQTAREIYSQSQQNKRNTETNKTNERMNTYKVDYGQLFSMGAAKTLGDLMYDVGQEGVNALYKLKSKFDQRGKPNPILNKVLGSG